MDLARHPNDPAEVRQALTAQVLTMHGRERRELLAYINAVLKRLATPRV